MIQIHSYYREDKKHSISFESIRINTTTFFNHTIKHLYIQIQIQNQSIPISNHKSPLLCLSFLVRDKRNLLRSHNSLLLSWSLHRHNRLHFCFLYWRHRLTCFFLQFLLILPSHPVSQNSIYIIFLFPLIVLSHNTLFLRNCMHHWRYFLIYAHPDSYSISYWKQSTIVPNLESKHRIVELGKIDCIPSVLYVQYVQFDESTFSLFTPYSIHKLSNSMENHNLECSSNEEYPFHDQTHLSSQELGCNHNGNWQEFCFVIYSFLLLLLTTYC